MPIGSDINATLPVAGPDGDSPSVAAARIIDTLEKLVLAVEGNVPSAAIDFTANVDLEANGILGAAFVGLDNQADDDAGDYEPGYLFRFGNDLYWVHPDGTVKLTDGLLLNAAATGGIGGDYGTGDESVSYDNTTDEYTFLDAPGNWSVLAVEGVKLVDPAGGSITLKADTASVSTDQDILFGALPASGTGILTQSSTGLVSCSGATSAAFAFGSSASFAGNVTHSAGVARPNRVMHISPTSNNVTGATEWIQSSGGGVACPASGTGSFILSVPLHTGDTIKSISVNTSAGTGSNDWDVVVVVEDSSGAITGGGAGSVTDMPAARANTTVNFTDHTMAANEVCFIRFTPTSGNAGVLHAVHLTYDEA